MNIEKAKEKFIKYSKAFDIENDNLKRKQLHSLRVMDISNKIAEHLNLSNEEIQVATLIGLLHDIGRFEQFTRYGTFRDRESVDHGDLGVEILKKDSYIKEYIDNEKYIDTIHLAVKNHNKYIIEKGLTSKQGMFCKIIRDADKIDIFYEATAIFYTPEDIEEINQSIINDGIIQKIHKMKTINRNELNEKGKLARLFVMLAFAFDINYKASYEILYKENYINKILARFDFKNQDTKNKIMEVQEFLNQYIQKKIQ